jgi:DNA-binding MarR family transcriptional regulator
VGKSTLTSLLIDRLEAAGLVTRGRGSRNRRARFPLLTEVGQYYLEADTA